jgi:hypothetical protein
VIINIVYVYYIKRILYPMYIFCFVFDNFDNSDNFLIISNTWAIIFEITLDNFLTDLVFSIHRCS